MRFEELIEQLGNVPVIDTETLLAGVSAPEAVKVQISRWEKAGKIIQIKRGIYLLADPYRKIDVYEPYLASMLKKPSYVSLEKALEYHDMIPEAVLVYTSVTTKRPAKYITKAGTFDYRHIRSDLFWGYNSVAVNKQTAFIASPEKALLDYFYLREIKISEPYLEEMRLHNVEQIDIGKLIDYARRFRKPGILRTAEIIKVYIESAERGEKRP
ncbi:MAG: hypothetical protein Q8N91_02810 [Candidatus Omnitrophota bacterium]|nr:hypothetical protein [Candidatus Omnitrophota bacterium]